MDENWYEDERWLRSPKHIVCAAVVVVNDDQDLLMVKSPRRGWEIPGGQVEQGERPAEAAAREAREESGIDVRIDDFCGAFINISQSICNLIFVGTAVGGELRTSLETPEIGWFRLPGALEKITFPSYRERIQMALDRSKWPFLVDYER